MFYLKIMFLMLIIFQIIKTSSISNEQLANQAIKKGYKELVEKILLDKDKKTSRS